MIWGDVFSFIFAIANHTHWPPPLRLDDPEHAASFRKLSAGAKVADALSKASSLCFRQRKVAPDPNMGRGAPRVNKDIVIQKRVKKKKAANVSHVKKKKGEAMYDAEKIKKMGDGSALRNKLI